MKNPPLKTLRKKLWKVFSEYVRRKEMGRCFTCAIIKDWKEMHAGHYHDASISNPTLSFDERNVHCQCPRCNNYLSGNKVAYAYNLTRRYGNNILEELMTIKNSQVKWTMEDFERRISYYKEALNEHR